MEKTAYCPMCDEYQPVSIHHIEEIFPIKGEPIQVMSNVAICDVCGETLCDCILDSDNLEKAYFKYRGKHGLLGPKAIRQIREECQMSQEEFANMLGWELETLRRYEIRAIISPEHNLQLLEIYPRPNSFDVLVEHAFKEYKKDAENLRDLMIYNPKPLKDIIRIEVFGWSDCPTCQRFVKKLTDSNIPYIYYDLGQDDEAYFRFLSRGFGITPLTLINNEICVEGDGFEEVVHQLYVALSKE